MSTTLSGTTISYTGLQVSNSRGPYFTVKGSGMLILDACSFIRIIGASTGGAVLCTVNLSMHQTTFIECKAANVGACALYYGSAELSHCVFDSCEAENYGAVYITSMPVAKISGCTLRGCRATTSSRGIGYTDALASHGPTTMTECFIIDMNNHQSHQLMWLYNAEMRNCTYTCLSREEVVISCTELLLDIYDCSFTGMKAVQCLILCKQDLQLFNCSFIDCTGEQGGIIVVSRTLVIDGCCFDNCKSIQGAGAINGTANMDIQWTNFTACASEEKASVLYVSKSSTVQTLCFKDCIISDLLANNDCGEVIYCELANADVIFENNTFSIHNSADSVICVTVDAGSLFVFRECRFLGNKDEGTTILQFLNLSTTSTPGKIELTGCRFEDIMQGSDGNGPVIGLLPSGNGIISLGSNPQCDWSFSQCVFDQCVCASGCLITAQSLSLSVRFLSFASCDFVQCQFGDGITSRDLEISELLCENCSFDRFNSPDSFIFWVENIRTNARFALCNVTKCVSSLNVHVGRLIFDNVEFIGIGTRWDIAAETECWFNYSTFDFSDNAGITVSCADTSVMNSDIKAESDTSIDLFSWFGRDRSAEILLVNCCFTGLGPSSSGHYVSFSGSGTATFDGTCFDQSRDKSLSIGGSVSIIELDEPSIMFGLCSCDGEYIGVTSSTLQPDYSVTLQPDSSVTLQPDSSVTLQPDASITLQPDSSITLQPDSANGSSKGGLIAGIVVAILVVASVAGALVFLFVFRLHRRRSDFSSSSDDDKPSTTTESTTEVEETVPWTNDNNPWEVPEDIAMWL